MLAIGRVVLRRRRRRRRRRHVARARRFPNVPAIGDSN